MSSSLKEIEAQKWPLPIGSNADQNYLTHGLFRYFGKLPPVLTGQVIDQFCPDDTSVVVDLMCGSGTTLVECQARGLASFGVDANEVAVLASRVKTTLPDLAKLERALHRLETMRGAHDRAVRAASLSNRLQAHIPEFPNRDRWFAISSQWSLAWTRQWINDMRADEPLIGDFLLLSWIGVIRASSQASVKTGRIFFDRDKPVPDVYALFVDRIRRNIDLMSRVPETQFETQASVQVGDARAVQLETADGAGLVLMHPPYFALYRYSSDVLRFELEWLGVDRKAIRAREIEDGFKTTDPALMGEYVSDLVAAMTNGFEHLAPGGNLVVVVGNSTLAEKQLPVVETLIERWSESGFRIDQVYERPISHSQVTYHRSAKPAIRSDSDFVLISHRE